MTPEERYNKDVIWLSETIPPDDIYDFALQSYQAAEYFLSKWADNVDIKAEFNNDSCARAWMKNIIGFRVVLNAKAKVRFDMEPNENYPHG